MYFMISLRPISSEKNNTLGGQLEQQAIARMWRQRKRKRPDRDKAVR